VLPILALAALFLGWRLLRRGFRLAARPYLVQSATPVADEMVEIVLKPLAEPIAATAGQFVLVAFFAGPTFRGCGEFHPFTVSAIGADGQIRVGVKALGDCTRRIQGIEPGVLARVHGAFGTFLAERPAAAQLWLAGGIGITPFLALLRRVRSGSRPRSSISTARRPTPPSCRNCARWPTAIHNSRCRRWPPAMRHRISIRCCPRQPRWPGIECYLCGPPAMIAAVRQSLRKRGVTPRHIHFENFGFR
jgi:predicted ferric reductase